MKTTEKKARNTTKLKSRINKDDFCDLISSGLGVSKLRSEHILETVVGIIKKSLKNNQSVMIKNFGVFEVRTTKEKTQFGKFSKKPKKIMPHKRAKFKASPTLIQELN